MEKLNKVFRTAQLAAIDKYTIEHEPVSSLDLMDRDLDRSFFENFH